MYKRMVFVLLNLEVITIQNVWLLPMQNRVRACYYWPVQLEGNEHKQDQST